MNPATRMMFDRMSGMAAQGLSYKEAAAELGTTYSYVASFANRHDIAWQLRKRGRPLGSGQTAPGERERDMLKRYTSGETLEAIGKSYRVTRERVRQLLTKHYNVCGKDGGQAETAREKKRSLNRKRDARALKSYGCSYRQYKTLLRHKDGPVHAYRCQKNSAAQRGIEWDLNIWQWWSIWQQSGHWSGRGRGHGYCMCRLNDVGPYSADNVYIATGSENMKDYWANIKSGDRSKPIYKRAGVSAASPEVAKERMRAAVARYQATPKFKLRHQLRRQGIPKEQRDAIVAQKFGARS